MKECIDFVNKNKISKKDIKINSVSFSCSIYEESYYIIDYPYRGYYRDVNNYITNNGLDLSTKVRENENSLDLSYYIYYDYTFGFDKEKVGEYRRGEAKNVNFILPHSLNVDNMKYNSAISEHMNPKKLRYDYLRVCHNFAFDPEYISNSRIHLIVFLKETKFGPFSGTIVLFVEAKRTLISEVSKYITHVEEEVFPVIEWRAWQIVNLVLNEQFKSKAIYTAVSAVMSRNMDHLLGSHIETAATHQMPDLRKEVHYIGEKFGIIGDMEDCTDNCYIDEFWEDSQYYKVEEDRKVRKEIDKVVRGLETKHSNYRLKRMDLIARFSTEWIPWGTGMSFFHQVMLPFLRNGMLLHFLGHGDNVSLTDIRFELRYPEDTSSEEDSSSEPASDGAPNEDSGDPFYKLPLAELGIQPNLPTPQVVDFMKIRGGDVGVHAYHILLENILRNSVKHGGKLGNSPKIKLKTWALRENPMSVLDEMNFQVREERRESFRRTVEKDKNQFWFILISSSADCGYDGGTPQAKADEIDGLLCRPLVKKTGETDPEAWGMKEKKICAAYLAELDSTDANADDPQYIWAGTLPWPEEEDDEDRLAYCLKIPKARFLIHVKDTPS